MMNLLLLLLGLTGLSWSQDAIPSEDIIEPGGPWRPPPETTTTQRPSVPASYWITYSKTVRPGYPMIFNVQILKGTSPVDVSISLKDVNGNVVLSKGPVSVSPGDPQDINIFVPLDVKRPEEKKGKSWWYYRQNYKVDVIGVGSELSFNESDSATYTEKAFSIFVQTDKAMYKPSQSVKCRTLAMTPDMKVMRDVEQNIIVKDSKGNRILQYRNVTASQTLGVVEKSFNLASSVPTGAWTIEVTIMDTKYEKTFEVSDYVLPRFEVKVEGSPYALLSDPLYEFSVGAIFTFGKPVTEGTVAVTIDMEYNWQQIRPVLKRGRLNKDGKFSVQVTRNELETFIKTKNEYNSLRWTNFIITANVTETRTGKTYSGTHAFKFYQSPFKVEFLTITPSVFKSGLDFTAYIEVTKRDEAPLSAEEVKNLKVHVMGTYNIPGVKPTTTTTTAPPPPPPPPNGTVSIKKDLIPVPYYRQYVPPITKNLTLDSNEFNVPQTGWIVVTFRVPDGATNINLQAETVSEIYETERGSFYAEKMYSPTDSFLQLSVVTQKVKVGETVRVNSKATDEFKELNVQIFSKGILIESKVIPNPSGTSKSLEFSFVATAAMSPSMSILAFYLKETGEFVNDGLSLSVDGIFDNAVSIEFSSPKVQPGEKVEAIVKGKKDSVVFLLAVDKSVKLLKSGNDITQDMVRQELAGYDYGNYGNWRYMFICGWPSYFGGSDAESVFRSAGVVVMTDGLVYQRRYPVFGPGISEADGVPVNAKPQSGSGSTPDSPPERTRRFFPENWLWSHVVITQEDSGEVRIPLTAPDTITTWIASVFSVNPSKGLSVAAQPGTVTTFRDLFVSLELPPSIVRGEIFCFSASVFSYYAGETTIILKLHNSTDFKSVYPQKENGQIVERKEELEYNHLISIKENEIVTKKFCFMPTVVGSITIDVSALTNVQGLSDRVERKILVKPEGVPHTTTKPHLVELNQQGVWTQAISMDFPQNTVKDSERVTINIAGNLLGPIFNNLEDLLRKPYGCGEQNMINFAPIMSLLDYFFTSNTITEEIRKKGVDYMMIGYQKEILYEHGKTGGFSTFGNSKTEENASTWLTAFITKCFALAEQLDMQHSNILAIDTAIILRSSNWMISQQGRDGMFVENGKVFNKNLQGGSGNGIALTAYTVIALHESWLVLNSSYERAELVKIEKGMQKAISYLEMNLPTLDDPYDICITAYALNLVDSSSKDRAFENMVFIAKVGSGMRYWSRPNQEKKQYYYWSRLNDAINIEMTAYALLTYSLRGIGTTDGLPIVRWLSKQKGENGGFISTQDTVIGVEALTSVAKKLHASEFVPMTIKVMNDKGITIETFQVTKANEMVLQRKDIPYQNGGTFQLSAVSNGALVSNQSTVLVDVVFHYNVESETVSSGYEMEFEVQDQTKNYELLVKVKTSDGKSAGMTILAVDIPAGFSPNFEAIKRKTPFVSTVDVKEDILNLYFQTDVIDGRSKDVYIIMESEGGNLLNPKDKSLQIYDYYESDKQLTKLVQLKSSRICDKEPDLGVCSYETVPSRPQVIT